MLRRTLVLAVAIAAITCQAAIASPTPPLGHSGRWITDADGRVAILHGHNMVYKLPPYYPGKAGFGRDDAEFLRHHGFNTIRLGVIYAGVEPQPGVYDNAYLNKIRTTERMLARFGIFSQIDFHQDLYNEKFQGEGWPDWAVQDDGAPNPQQGFPNNYFVNPALHRAFDHFWANDPGPGGVGLQDRYAAAFRRVASRFRNEPYVMGYDLMNEPWPGSPWTTCASPEGCPAFDMNSLTPFSNRVIDRIRKADQRNLVWYEPNSVFNAGAQTHHGDTGDPDAGFSFHIYCLTTVFGGAGSGESCDTLEERVFDQADAHSEETGDALLLSEFAATNELGLIRRIVDNADRHMISWQHWHYCECGDPTTQGPGIQSIVPDADKRPSGDNVNLPKVRALSRPYPRAIAGRPSSFFYDRRIRHFELTYRRGGVDGNPLPRWLRTEVFIPPLHYPRGYEVRVTGGHVVSPDDARILRIVRDRGAKQVTVDVRNAGATFSMPAP